MEESCSESPPYFEVIGMDIFPLSLGNETQITTSNPIEWNKFTYLVGFDIMGIAQRNLSSSGNLFALDCIQVGYLGSKIGIESLTIRPLTDYSEIDTPESFTSSLFRLEVIKESISIEEFNLIFKESFSFQKFNIKLNRAPQVGGEIQKFEIEIVFSNGKKVIQTTPELRILR